MPYKEGIVEQYCSGQFFPAYGGCSGLHCYIKAVNGDKEAVELFNEFGVHLGNAMINILYSFDPEAIILGGAVSDSFDLFKDSMWRTIGSFPYKRTVDGLVVVRSSVEHSAVLGAAALCYDKWNNK